MLLLALILRSQIKEHKEGQKIVEVTPIAKPLVKNFWHRHCAGLSHNLILRRLASNSVATIGTTMQLAIQSANTQAVRLNQGRKFIKIPFDALVAAKCPAQMLRRQGCGFSKNIR